MDDTTLILIFSVLFAVGLYRWAEAWGRNGWVFAACSLFLSPLISGIILLLVGRTDEKKEDILFEKMKQEERLKTRLAEEDSNA